MQETKKTYTASEELAVSEMPQVVGNEKCAQGQTEAEQCSIWLIFLDGWVNRLHRWTNTAVKPVMTNFINKIQFGQISVYVHVHKCRRDIFQHQRVRLIQRVGRRCIERCQGWLNTAVLGRQWMLLENLIQFDQALVNVQQRDQGGENLLSESRKSFHQH